MLTFSDRRVRRKMPKVKGPTPEELIEKLQVFLFSYASSSTLYPCE